jgi:pentatricopeptide repeat protein
MTVFDTETMAELCVKQGRFDQAIDIFRRLAEQSSDPGDRRRFETRIAELGQGTSAAPIEIPGLRVTERAGTVEIEWRLPPDLAVPTLQLLLLRRTPEGIQADSRTLPLAAAQGRTVVTVSDLCGVRAAAGRLDGDAFVPLVRFPDRIV